jgi:hypothetical protein
MGAISEALLACPVRALMAAKVCPARDLLVGGRLSPAISEVPSEPMLVEVAVVVGIVE